MTNETMTWNGWLSEVLSTAGVSVDSLEPFRSQVQRWYAAGEPVWMAADSLKMIVKERSRQVRIQQQAEKDMPGSSLRKSYVR